MIDLNQGEEEKELQEEEEEENTQEALQDHDGETKQGEHKSKSTYTLRNSKTIQTPQRFNYLCHKSPITPSSCDEALATPERESWIRAMDIEMEFHRKNHTWELLKPNQDMSPLSARRIYRIKFKANGHIDGFKARLDIKEYEQNYSVDYTETFSPIVWYDTKISCSQRQSCVALSTTKAEYMAAAILLNVTEATCIE